MKRIIAASVGVLALGGALAAGVRRSAPVDALAQDSPAASAAAPALAAPAAGPLVVNCGPGRQALFRPSASGSSATQVECVPGPIDPLATDVAPLHASNLTMPEPARSAVRPAVYERAPARTAPARRTARRPVVRDRVVYRTEPVAQRSRVRSRKRSALIIGGSAAGGAGLGAVLGGRSGAKKGAVIGGLGGLVYDIATREKKN